jgi:hypothetical protein
MDTVLQIWKLTSATVPSEARFDEAETRMNP